METDFLANTSSSITRLREPHANSLWCESHLHPGPAQPEY